MRSLIALCIILFSFAAAPAMAAAVEARIDLSQQRMTVYKHGRLIHSWPVSTARRGYVTPTGSYRPTRMYTEYYSKKYNNCVDPIARAINDGVVKLFLGTFRVA